MPLCKPTIVANSKLQWVTIKQDTHLALQECKIVGKSWWSSGDVSWGYRVIITANETQIAYAGDITQIVTDWEVLQKLVSEEPPLDPESSPAASAEVIERMLQRRWDEKQGGKEKHDGAESQSGKEKEKEAIVTDSSSSSSSSSSSTNTLSAEVKPTFEKRSSSRIFFRSGSTSTAIKRLAVGASESSPFPGIPLHREGQPSPRLGGGGPNSPRARAATTLESPRSAAIGRSRDEESTITKPIPEAAAAQNDQSGREREMREKYERSLHALKDKAAAPQHDDHYRVYVDCINGILHELQAVRNVDGKGSPDEAQTTAEVLCQLSRTSLDAARMLVAQQKAARERVGVTVQVTAAEEEGSSSRPPTEDEQQKAKEGQGDAEVGSGDTEKAMNSSSAVDPSEQAKQEVDKNSSGDDAKKRLQRCVELFTVANKSLASMTQPPSDVAQE